MSENDIKSKIKEQYKKYSKSQKKIAEYFLEFHAQAAFLSAKQVGENLNLSEATVLRFSKQLGYDHYPKFKQMLGLGISSQQNDLPIDSTRTYGETEEGSGIANRILTREIFHVQNTLKNIDPKMFEAAVQMLTSARKVYVIGLRNSKPLAIYLSHYLNYLLKDVRVLTATGSEEILEQMYHITSEDLIFGISFPRYSIRTLKALEFANQRNAKVITLTDQTNSPINLYSSCNLLAQSSTSFMIESLTAPLSLLHALLVAVCEQKKDEIQISMQQLEKIWDEYKVFGGDNMEFIEK